MTRENKLALIIGFTLILMVGVLVSDHLSRARTARLDEAAAAEPGENSERVAFSGTLLSSAIEEAQKRGLEQAPVATRIGVAPSAGSPVPAQPAPDPIVIAQGETMLSGEPGAGSTPADSIAERFRTWAEATGTAWERLGNSATPPETKTIGARSPTGSEIPSAAALPVPTRQDLPRAVTHRVVAGDSLYKLAQKYLGNGNRWKEIQQANPGRVSPDGGLTVGVRLTIPVLEEADHPTGAVRPAPVAASGPSEYVVKPGDTLSAIASSLLGSSRRAGEIVEANRGTIDDADEIRVGMTLKIPAR